MTAGAREEIDMPRSLYDDSLELDAATLEWLAFESFPHRALGADPGTISSHDIPAFPPDPATADWLSSQEFPIRPLLFHNPSQRVHRHATCSAEPETAPSAAVRRARGDRRVIGVKNGIPASAYRRRCGGIISTGQLSGG